jgi:CRP-like cAMP-binding protein
MMQNNMQAIAFIRKSHLFDGFSSHQLEQLLPLMREVQAAAGEVIIRENESSDELYLIKEGAVEVTKLEPETGSVLQLALLEPGAIVGELTLLDDAPRSASVRAVQATVLWAFSISELRTLAPGQRVYQRIADKLMELAQEAQAISSEPPVYAVMVQNLAKNLSQRMRVANEAMLEGLRKELAQTKARAAMGLLITGIMVVMAIYTIVIDVFSHSKLVSSTVLSTPLIAIFSIIVFWTLKKTGYPLAYYGLTLKNWRQSAIEGVAYTIPLLLVIVIYKWFLITFAAAQTGRHLFEFNAAAMQFHSPLLANISMLLIYLAFVPLQEMIVRGGLQSALQELLISPRKVLWAILLSNLLFSVTHFHISIGIGLVAYVPGLFWGWLYARHRTLVGVVISHALVGSWALFVVGFFH